MRLKVWRGVAGLCAIVATAGVLAGDADGGLSEADYLGELPIVLSATRLQQPLSETPAALTVIDRQMIRDSGAWDVADLFRLVPGMYVAYNVDKEIVPGHVVSYHGMADPYAKRMQILVDGRSVYTPLFGGPVWSNIPLALDDIERIEVVRGPSAATYGANSFLGVINIITRDPSETHGNRLSFTGGSAGRDATWRHGGGNGDTDYRLTLQWRDDRGYTKRPSRLEDGKSVTERHDDKRIHNLALRVGHRLGARDELQFHFGHSGGTREAGELGNTHLPFHEKDVQSQYWMLQWQRSLAPDNQVSLRFFHNRDVFDLDLGGRIGTTVFPPLVLDAPAPLDSPLRHVAERYDLEFQHHFSPSASTRLVWGGGTRRDRVHSRLYFNRSGFVDFHQVNAFANLEWRPHAAWLLNLGTMVENNDFTGTRASPRLGVNFHLAEGHTLRATASRAWRNPVIYEQRGNSHWRFTSLAPVPGISVPFQYLYGRDNLAPERIDSNEVGYLIGLPRGGTLDFKVSHDRIRDLIEMLRFACGPAQMALPQCAASTPGTDVRLFENSGAVNVESREVQWQQTLWQGTRVHFGWASVRVRGLRTLTGESYGNSTPRHSWSLLLSHAFGGGWRGSLAGYYTKPLETLGGHPVPAYRRWDMRLGREFRFAGHDAEAALVVQNADRSHDREFYRDNAFGRRILASLRFDF